MFERIIPVFKGDKEDIKTTYVIAVYRKELGYWCPSDEFENINDAKMKLEELKNKTEGCELAIFKYVETISVKKCID